MSVRRFRALVFIHIALLAAIVALSLLPAGYSPALAHAYAAESSGWLGQPAGWRHVLIVVAGALWIAGHVGLLLLRRWGRSLFLAATPLGPAIIALGGPVLTSGIHSALADIDSVVWGAILAIAFYSPVSARFAKPMGVVATK